MSASKRHSLALLATVLLTAAIAYMTLTPPRPEASAGLLSDKAYHVIAFASLIFPGTLLYLRSLIWLIPAALVFGAAIELIQPLVGRSAEFADFVADGVGVACGLILGLIMRRRWFQPRRDQKPRAVPVKASR
jgi:VanZ family protein